jgi:pimeloyl-ACP methyl ester carboxylesterase
MPVVPTAAAGLAYEEHGEGPPLLLVHGEAGGRLAWRETLAALGGSLRAIAYDRRGWGETGMPPDYAATTVEEHADDAAALARALGAAPCVVCGDGFGALACLDLLLRHAGVARAAVLVEPPLASLSLAGSELVAQLRDAVEEAARAGGAPAAVDAFLAGVAGEPALELLGRERLAVARAAPRVVFAEFRAVHAWEYTRAALREVGVPVAIVHGRRSHPVWREAARGLARLVPGARAVELDAGHALALERPGELAACVRELAGA